MPLPEMQILHGHGGLRRSRDRPGRGHRDPRARDLPHPSAGGGAGCRGGSASTKGRAWRAKSCSAPAPAPARTSATSWPPSSTPTSCCSPIRNFLGRVESRIRSQQVNAEWAVHKTAEELDNLFAHMDDAYLRERSEDLTDVSRHLLRSLQGISHHELSELHDDVIIVADDLTPSDVIRLGRQHVIGFAIESGGRTSHTTIIARSLNLPLVSGLAGVTNRLTDQAPIIVDGETGQVFLHPNAETLERYRERRLRAPVARPHADGDARPGRGHLRRLRDPADGQHRPARGGPRGLLLRRRGHRPLPQRVPLPREEPRPADRRRARGHLPPDDRGGGAAPGDHPHLRSGRPQAGARGHGHPGGEPGARPARHPPHAGAARRVPHPDPRPLPGRRLRRPLGDAAAGQPPGGGARLPGVRRRTAWPSSSARGCRSAATCAWGS